MRAPLVARVAICVGSLRCSHLRSSFFLPAS